MPVPLLVTAPFSATDGAGHSSRPVLAPPAGTTALALTLVVRITFAARAAAGAAASAASTQSEAANLKGISHANTVSRPGYRFYAGRAMGALTSIIAQAGGGSSGFGGGGGGGGFSGGGGSSGSGEGDPIVAAVVFGLFGIFLLYLFIHSVRYRRKLRERDKRVRTASAEAAEDDAYFASDELERHAVALFRAAQTAWDARDRAALARLVGPDLLVEWNRRLDDFDSKGWHNRVEVLGDPAVLYVGLVNREDDTEDRAVVRVDAKLRAYVLDSNGDKVMRKGEKDEF